MDRFRITTILPACLWPDPDGLSTDYNPSQLHYQIPLSGDGEMQDVFLARSVDEVKGRSVVGMADLPGIDGDELWRISIIASYFGVATVPWAW